MPMKKLIVFYFLMLVNIAFAQTEKGILFKISGNGLEQPSYIMGIVNFLPADRFIIPEALENALAQCQVLATKTELNQRTQRKFNEAIKIPNNGWINDYLTDDELNQLRLLMLLDLDVKEHAYHDYYSRLQPIILVTVTNALNLKENIIYTEQKLHELAKKHKLKLAGLGTIEEEIEAFSQFPIQDQVEALKYTVNNYYDHIAEYQNLVNSYLNDQNLNYVEKETFKATNESKAFKKVYYENRSLKWLAEVEKLINKKPTFIALGAPFLVGESGLLALLKNKGYAITSVPLQFKN